MEMAGEELGMSSHYSGLAPEAICTLAQATGSAMTNKTGGVDRAATFQTNLLGFGLSANAVSDAVEAL